MEMEKAREETRIMATVAAREATKTWERLRRPAEPEARGESGVQVSTIVG